MLAITAPDPFITTTQRPSEHDFRRLFELRTSLRRFLRWSEDQARAVGLTSAQHQLLLAVHGHPDAHGPTSAMWLAI